MCLRACSNRCYRRYCAAVLHWWGGEVIQKIWETSNYADVKGLVLSHDVGLRNASFWIGKLLVVFPVLLHVGHCMGCTYVSHDVSRKAISFVKISCCQSYAVKHFLLSLLFGYPARWHFHLKAQPLKTHTHTHKVSVCSGSKHLATQSQRWYWSRSKYSSPATPTQNGHNWRDFGVAILRQQLVVVSEDLIIWNCNQYQYYQWYPIGTPRLHQYFLTDWIFDTWNPWDSRFISTGHFDDLFSQPTST